LEQTEEIPYCTDFEDMKLGIGVKLYFKTLGYTLFVYLIGFLLYSLYSIITNAETAGIQINNVGTTNLLCLFNGNCGVASIGSGSKAVTNTPDSQSKTLIQNILGVVIIFFWGILNVYRKHTKK